MRYLIDTQIAIWAKENNPRLTPRGRNILEDFQNDIFVSQFSLMELAVKLKIGKLPDFIISIETFTETLTRDGFKILPVSNQHIFAYQAVPLYEDHRDPFDRYILAAAYTENLPLISADSQFYKYSSFVELIKI